MRKNIKLYQSDGDFITYSAMGDNESNIYYIKFENLRNMKIFQAICIFYGLDASTLAPEEDFKIMVVVPVNMNFFCYENEEVIVHKKYSFFEKQPFMKAVTRNIENDFMEIIVTIYNMILKINEISERC